MNILIIEDQDSARQKLKKMLGKHNHTCTLLPNGEKIDPLDVVKQYNLVIIDHDLGDYNKTGMTIGRLLREKAKVSGVDIKLVMLTAYGDDIELKEAALSGVFDAFLSKPLNIKDLEVFMVPTEPTASFSPDIIGNSPKLIAVLKLAEVYAKSNLHVLIMGEPGTGKEGMARAIHEHSARKAEPYIVVNCAGFNEGTLESELFGHVKGSFTGANQNREGYFEQANNGTIFLDEVGDMPLVMQAKLLRVLQSGDIQKVGSSKPSKVNVRVIAASNKNIHEMVKTGAFRQDLYDRISVMTLRLPPLRERREDIMPLAKYFINQCQLKNNDTRPVSFDSDSENTLLGMEWRGNIRNLEGSMQLTYHQYPREDKKIVITRDRLKIVPAEENHPVISGSKKTVTDDDHKSKIGTSSSVAIEGNQSNTLNELTLLEIADLLNNIQLRQELDGTKPGDMILLENAYINLVKKIIDKAQDRKGSMIQALSFLAGEDLGELSYLSTAIHKRIQSKLRLFKGLKTPVNGRIPRGRTGKKKKSDVTK